MTWRYMYKQYQWSALVFMNLLLDTIYIFWHRAVTWQRSWHVDLKLAHPSTWWFFHFITISNQETTCKFGGFSGILHYQNGTFTSTVSDIRVIDFGWQGVCTEAGMYALRERRVHVTQEDFELAVAKVCLSSFIFWAQAADISVVLLDLWWKILYLLMQAILSARFNCKL